MSDPSASIERATAADLPAVLSLLDDHGLPRTGLAAHVATLLVARRSGHVVGSAGLEMYGARALLRSVAVARPAQGTGLGGRLVGAAIDLARGSGVREIYLLTTTAERFFPRFGFEAIGREDVPAEVRQSVEFTSACPASAVAMRKALDR